MADALPPVIVLNRPSQDPLSLHILHALGAPLSSYLGLPLIVDGRLVGALNVIARAKTASTMPMPRLFATLKEPFFGAMSNALQHEQAITLKNRLAEENQEPRRAPRHRVGKQIVAADFGLREVIGQVRPLRVLQLREIERVGGTERIPVDIRIVVATNRDLATMGGKIHGQGGGAELLGVNPNTLRSKMHKLGIAFPAKHKGS